MSKVKEAISHFEHGLTHDIYSEPVVTYVETALAALRAQAEAERNEPLTLEEMRLMEGEPVWLEQIEYCAGCKSKWIVLSRDEIRWIYDGLGRGMYGERFVFYRYKPENGR